ncbi:pyocin knob domain-containing protein [Akkermansiaceae bacterium]|nr:pyocin knob domain-containing protein [Akkermansiaceae bacterium]
MIFSSDAGFSDLALTQISAVTGTPVQSVSDTFSANGDTSASWQSITLVANTNLSVSVALNTLFGGDGFSNTSSTLATADALVEIPDNFTLQMQYSSDGGSNWNNIAITTGGTGNSQQFTKTTSTSPTAQQYSVEITNESEPVFFVAFADVRKGNTLSNYGSVDANGFTNITGTITGLAGATGGTTYKFRTLVTTTDSGYNTVNKVTATAPRTLTITDTSGDGFYIDNGDGSQTVPTGDITSVSAGTNLNGGGTSGAVTLNLDSTISGDHTFSNNVVIGGNLDVQGTTTTIDTTNLDVKDKNITLNYGTGDTSANANGAGITIQDAVNSTTDATLTWNTSNDSFNFSHPVNVTGNLKTTGNLDVDGIIDNTRNNGNVSAPNTSDHTAGTRINFYDATATSWYAMGIESSTLWFNTDSKYKWYQDAAIRMTLDGANLTVTGNVTATGGNSTNWNTAYTYSQTDADVLRKRTDIPNAANLNTYTAIGLYHQNSNAQATAGSNYPANVAGMLTVKADGVMVYQVYQGYGVNKTYERKYYNGTWYAWAEVGAGTTINSNADNRIITGSGTANTLNAESGLTYNGSALAVTGTITSGAITSSGNLHAGDGTNISMDSSANGQLEVDGNGYQGAIALDGSAMHIYQNSASRNLVLGTNETARLTISGTGGFNFESNPVQGITTLSSGAITVDKANGTGAVVGMQLLSGSSQGDSIAINFGSTTANEYSLLYDHYTNRLNLTDGGSNVFYVAGGVVNFSSAPVFGGGLTVPSLSVTGNGTIQTGAAGLIKGGYYQVGSTTVIDTSRTLTNIGTISSGAVEINAGSTVNRFHCNQTSVDDWATSPISIRERGLNTNASTSSTFAPNLNFHWGSVVSRSLTMLSDGSFVLGEWGAGTPNTTSGLSTLNTGAYQINATTIINSSLLGLLIINYKLKNK